MSKRKVILSMLSIMFVIVLMIIPNKVSAVTTLTTPMYFGVNEFRGTNPDSFGYAIGNPYDNGDINSIVGAKIWQIVKYNGPTDTNSNTGNYYCVRAGVGFSDTNLRAEYNIAYDLKNDKALLAASSNKYLQKIATNGYYNNLLALSDLLYLKGVSTDAEKTSLLNSAGIYAEDYTALMTDDDIEAVQQAAVWYYSNHDDVNFEKVYNNLGEDKTSWLFYRTLEMSQQGKTYTSLSDYKLTFNNEGKKVGEGKQRQEQAVMLYNYLINTANKNASTYENGTANTITKITLYSNATIEETQPIVLIERKPETREFDLALRKYITKVDGTVLEQANSRVPNIDVSTIETNKTATSNRIEFQTSGTNNLVEFNGTNLDSDTIQIEAEVIARANTKSDTILTNVAWISEEYDAVAKETITNVVGKDRDSEPSTIPNVNKDNMSNYTGNNNKQDLTDSNFYYKGQQDDDDFEKLKLNKEQEGSYNLILVKEDANGEQLDSKATFEVNGQTKTVIGRLQVATDVKITSENVNKQDTYVIKETVAPDKYCEFDGTINVTVTKKMENNTYKVDSVSYKVTDENGKDITEQTKGKTNVYLKDGNIYVEVKNYQFDLKLIKRIVEVNGTKVPERIEGIDISKLADGTQTTADYKLNKNPVTVKKGDIVKYTLRIYNEGQVDGYASEISEDVPEGLEFVWSEKTDDELDADTTLTKEEKEAIKYNQGIWDIKTVNKDTKRVELVTTDYLAKGKGAEIKNDGANLLKAFDPSKQYKDVINDKNPDYREVSVFMRVIAENNSKEIIRNEAAITKDTDKNGKPIDDRDSDTDKWVKYEDDEDYDNVIVQTFDVALRKFIIAVSKDEEVKDTDYLKNSNGTYTRAPIVDTSKLNTKGEDGKVITTATYNHTKQPVEVVKGDYVIYMLRVYNESDLDGYASEIKDYLPPYLTYVDGEFNKKYGWTVSEDGRTVTTKYLDNYMISKTSTNDKGEIVLSYKEVPIMCRVTNNAVGKITNIAEITEYKDENKKPIEDRDSQPKNVVLPSDDKLPEYQDDKTGSYIPGQQDDDDFEKVIVKKFDLALRKFITAVNENEVTTRIPQVKYDKENNHITYEHTKEPVNVVTDNIVVYTIRVFNEGEIDGYASKVSDDMPKGLEYLPNNELNKEYRWVMYDSEGKETENVADAVKITTDYLSKEQGEARMKANSELKENPALLKAFDGNKAIDENNPDYADVQVAFKVVEPNTSDKIIVNSAQITDDTDKDGNPVDDDDSTTDKWIEGEDDQDREYIKLNYFDLALRKWVTQAIVIENGKETVTETGHKAEDDPEQVVKVELNRKKLNSLQVKFKYSIRVTNEGDIAGYAKEIKDYIPEGLKFVAEDNADWKDEGNNVISTRKLENTLLQPGESAEVEVLLTWINGKDNLGLKTNIAEISEDYNDWHAHDIDSTPDNKVPGEDDIDDAPVLLSISTGEARVYFALGLTVLITIAGGIILIRKYVM